jgi:hypothetical protein
MGNYWDRDNERLERMSKFQLPNRYKKIGWIIVVIAFVLMVAKKFIDEPSWLKPFFINMLIIGFLLVSLAKEKIEDELIVKLRAQSYRFAFVFGVVYSLTQPYINYAVSYLFDSEKASIDFTYFQVLIFMLIVQILSFRQFKRMH